MSCIKRLERHWKDDPDILVGIRWLVSVAIFGGIVGLFSDWQMLRGFGFFLLGVGVAPLGLYLANKRTTSLETQTNTEKEKAVTDSFAKSVELLGNKRAAARQGGIHALGRLAKDNSDLHPMIMNIVTSYIRQESRTWFNDRKTLKEGDTIKETFADEKVIGILKTEPMPMDIEAAITVIRERNFDYDKEPEGDEYILDLSNAYIFNANFSNTSLCQVNFSDSKIINCIFEGTDLTGSYFLAADISGTFLDDKQQKSADFG